MAVKNRVTLENHDELFKDFYVPIADAAVNTATPFRVALRRIKNFTGRQIKGAAKLSIGGGVGNGVIPVGSTYKAEDISYTPQPLWATTVLDWEAVVSSGDDKGAFVDVTVDSVEGTMTAFVNNEERQFFGTPAGALGTLNTVVPVDNADGTWSMTISAATWFYPNWEAGNVINIGADGTPFEITRVNRSTRVITFNRRDGHTYDPTTASSTAIIYMQNSKDKELIGLKHICDTRDNGGSNTLFGVPVQPRFEAREYDAASTPLIPDMLTEMIELQAEDTGEIYTDAWMNSVQYASLVNQLEGKKEYTQLKSDDKRYADMGFKMLTFTSRYGEVRIGTARFCPRDRVYFTTKQYMEVRERPRFGWLNMDGNKFLRGFQDGEKPVYKAHYGGFEQFYAHPAYVGYIKGLEVPAFAS